MRKPIKSIFLFLRDFRRTFIIDTKEYQVLFLKLILKYLIYSWYSFWVIYTFLTDAAVYRANLKNSLFLEEYNIFCALETFVQKNLMIILKPWLVMFMSFEENLMR